MTPTYRKQCPRCGRTAAAEARLCEQCGKRYPADTVPRPDGRAPTAQGAQRQAYPVSSGKIQMAPGRHFAVVASLLSVLFPGIGQLVNRQFAKGLLILLLALMCLQMPPCWIVLWGSSLVDTIGVARRLLRGEAVEPWQFF